MLSDSSPPFLFISWFSPAIESLSDIIVQMDRSFSFGIHVNIVVSAAASIDFNEPSHFSMQLCFITPWISPMEEMCFEQTPHFLLSTTLSIIFEMAPISNAWTVSDEYLPPEDHTCQPMSKETCTWWPGISVSNKTWSTELFGKSNVSKISSLVAFTYVLHFSASTVGYIFFSKAENCQGHLWARGKSRKAATVAAYTPPAPICCNARVSHKFASYLHISLNVCVGAMFCLALIRPSFYSMYYRSLLL